MMINPNCSEIVAKLPVQKIEDAKDFLEKNSNIKVIKFDSYHGMLSGLMEDTSPNIVDPDNPNTLDFNHGSTMSIYEGNYSDYDCDGDTGIFIVASQHCQHQLFETIHKLKDEKGLEFYGFDGGGGFDDNYDTWLDEFGRGKTPDYQDNIRKITKKILKNKKTIKELNNMNEITKTVTSAWEAREIREKNIKIFLKKLQENDKEFQKDVQAYVKALRENDNDKWTANKTDEELANSMFDNMKHGVAKSVMLCMESEELREIFFNNAREVQE